MWPTIGIVGPRNSVNLISDIASEHNKKMKSIPFIYQNTNEATSILKKNQNKVDIWLFAGPALYNPAQKSGSKQPFYYLKLDGSSLMKTFVEIGYKGKQNLERVSVDMLTERDVYETYRDLNIPSDQVYVHEYYVDTPIEDLLTFHEKLYKKGKVDFCVTCLYSIYEDLCAQDIPAYYVSPTRTNVRETLKTAVQQWETNHLKQAQIAVLLIKVENTGKKEDHNMISYDLHRLNLKIHTAVLNFSELISGSFMAHGIGNFMVYSTRGSLENHQVRTLLEKLTFITDLPANIGIGYGDSALVAEENAWIALNHAQNYDSFCAFLVENNGVVEGPLKEKETISFSYRTKNKEISDKLKKSGVTITTFNKILSVQSKIGKRFISASDLADWLKMTPRNARRILNGLVEQGLAEIIGEEAPISKGRPRKIYRVKVD